MDQPMDQPVEKPLEKPVEILKRRVTIQCCLCGVVYDPSETKVNICTNCLVQQSNITENLSSNEIVQQCTHCKRYNRPPWVLCDRESKELLSICLKKVKGYQMGNLNLFSLDQLKLIDASMLFTEPSSKTLRIRITVQKEVMNEASLQQTHIVEFREEYKQCIDCRKEFTPHTWLVSVQVRQRVEHKKTFLHLEQLILQNHMQDRALKIESVDEGLDFFYRTVQHGREMVQFLQAHLPVQIKHSTELVSQDFKSNTQHIKHTYSVQIPRICKGNLVLLPQKLVNSLGGVGQVLLCYKVTSIIHLFDPQTLRCTELTSEKYFQYEVDIRVFEVKKDGVEFTVLDVEKLKTPQTSNAVHAQLYSKCVLVNVMRDTGDYEQVAVKCHLGNIQVGSTVIGFDLMHINNVLSDCSNKPDIVLVQVKKEKIKKLTKVQRLKIESLELRKQNKKQIQKQEDKDEEELDEYLDEEEDQPITDTKISTEIKQNE